MRYAVFARIVATVREAELVGLTSLVSDAIAMAENRRAEGFVVSVRSVSRADATLLAGLDSWLPWVPWAELPGVECLPPEEVRA